MLALTISLPRGNETFHAALGNIKQSGLPIPANELNESVAVLSRRNLWLALGKLRPEGPAEAFLHNPSQLNRHEAPLTTTTLTIIDNPFTTTFVDIHVACNINALALICYLSLILHHCMCHNLTQTNRSILTTRSHQRCWAGCRSPPET